MYEAMDLLQKHNTEVEEAIFFRTASLMELEVDLVFYDTTTISFSIDITDEAEEVGSDSAVWSTQGRQLVVALAVTRQGTRTQLGLPWQHDRRHHRCQSQARPQRVETGSCAIRR